MTCKQKPVFVEVTNCQECPCLSHEELDCACNLGGTSDLRWRQDKKLIYCAENCPLAHVELDNGARFFPETALVTKVRPENWLI